MCPVSAAGSSAALEAKVGTEAAAPAAAAVFNSERRLNAGGLHFFVSPVADRWAACRLCFDASGNCCPSGQRMVRRRSFWARRLCFSVPRIFLPRFHYVEPNEIKFSSPRPHQYLPPHRFRQNLYRTFLYRVRTIKSSIKPRHHAEYKGPCFRWNHYSHHRRRSSLRRLYHSSRPTRRTSRPRGRGKTPSNPHGRSVSGQRGCHAPCA